MSAAVYTKIMFFFRHIILLLCHFNNSLLLTVQQWICVCRWELFQLKWHIDTSYITQHSGMWYRHSALFLSSRDKNDKIYVSHAGSLAWVIWVTFDCLINISTEYQNLVGVWVMYPFIFLPLSMYMQGASSIKTS